MEEPMTVNLNITRNPSNASEPASRRTILKAAGLGVGAGMLSGLASAAQAQGAAVAAPAAAGAPVWSGEYATKKGEIDLYIYRKRVGAPVAGERARPVLFMVHGSSNSARTSYDLQVPAKGEYSMMDVFARNGFDVWTMDHEGYGFSSRSSGNSDIKSGVDDLKLAAEEVKRFGQSAEPIAHTARRPEKIERCPLPSRGSLRRNRARPPVRAAGKSPRRCFLHLSLRRPK